MTVMDSTPAATPPAVDAFYDARRDVYYTKPVLRGWLHLLWFEASLVLGTLLLARAHGATRIAAAAIYAASVSALFGVSALYHRGNWTACVASAPAAPGPRDDLLPHRRHGNSLSSSLHVAPSAWSA